MAGVVAQRIRKWLVQNVVCIISGGQERGGSSRIGALMQRGKNMASVNEDEDRSVRSLGLHLQNNLVPQSTKIVLQLSQRISYVKLRHGSQDALWLRNQIPIGGEEYLAGNVYEVREQHAVTMRDVVPKDRFRYPELVHGEREPIRIAFRDACNDARDYALC